MIYYNGMWINEKAKNNPFYPPEIASNGQPPPKIDLGWDSEDEFDSNGDYKGNHHGQLILTADTLRDGTAWKDTSPGLPSTTAPPTTENSCKRRKTNHQSIVPKITVISPDGLVSYGSWDTPVRMARMETSPADGQLLHVKWRSARASEEPGCQSASLQYEQGQYTLATIDDGIARLVMKKKVSVKDKDGDGKLLD
ncbi:hypothetical protein PspLS_03809 [Pyricularia sp. CBS 133598]|nr:hypothetical protein PspLS_03809 [Pyricularia sp. CBS 133598]